jgi:hypothetical protein
MVVYCNRACQSGDAHKKMCEEAHRWTKMQIKPIIVLTLSYQDCKMYLFQINNKARVYPTVSSIHPLLRSLAD